MQICGGVTGLCGTEGPSSSGSMGTRCTAVLTTHRGKVAGATETVTLAALLTVLPTRMRSAPAQQRLVLRRDARVQHAA